MRFSPEVRVLSFLGAYVVFVISLRTGYHIYMDSRVVWDPNRPWWRGPTDMYIAWPNALLSNDCLIPEVGQGALPAKQWCLPDSRLHRRLQAEKIDAIVAEMRTTPNTIGVSAVELGYFVQLLLFKNTVMLNPRIIMYEDPSTCLVATDSKHVRITYFKKTVVEYETLGFGRHNLTTRANDACLMTFLLQTFTS
jgi:hypothetical protein